MTYYGVMLGMATLGIATILGLGLSNGGNGGGPDWAVVGMGTGLLLCKLAVIGGLIQRERRH